MIRRPIAVLSGISWCHESNVHLFEVLLIVLTISSGGRS
jgi:hypothetical protein